jgi:hypothetical protein
VTTQPDTDAPPWCTCQRRDALGPYVPCHLHDVASDTPQEGRPTTPQTEAYVRARQFYNERNLPQPYYDLLDEAVREAAAGALPSVERLADALPQVLNFEFFGHPVGHPKWQEIAQLIVAELEGSGPASFHESNRLHAAARLVAAPPEASER